QGASILDGCDGEVAKLKNKKTKIGAWLDTLSDNIIYVFFLLCMGIGFYEWQSQKFYLYLSMSSLVFLISSLGFMYFYLKDQKEEGSLVWVERSINQLGKSRRIFLSFIPRHLSFVAKRDFFALAFFILALFEMWFPISVCVLIGSAFVFIYSVLLVIHRNKVGKPNWMSYNVNPA
ncbi:MAG: hypothetical protein HYS98_00310, partial [Deltaproteobacteria bacterium]|nr:hypothetical protein [Deltaproteobacteria bacterium]